MASLAQYVRYGQGLTCALLLGTLGVAVVAATAPPMKAGVFLAGRGPAPANLLQELERISGIDRRLETEKRVGPLEDALRPMFAAMPKDAGGLLGSDGVRYLLHRLFWRRHAWHVNGLGNGGESWNSSSPAVIFKTHASEHQNLFEGELGKRGFSLHQTAVFAAAFETLVQGENLERLEAGQRVLGLGLEHAKGHVSEDDAVRLLLAYAKIKLTTKASSNLSALTRSQFEVTDATESVYRWGEIEELAISARQRVLAHTPSSARNTKGTWLDIVEEFHNGYSHWSDTECKNIKRLLVDMDEDGTGRVRLDQFYGDALTNDQWPFLEKVSYLRQQGILDESNPKSMRVIIPNYVYSSSNCDAVEFKFYHMCCVNECEPLMGALERSIAAPYAEPAHIVELVARLPSSTVLAPRSLPNSLIQLLGTIAAQHGGRVPLHGRLFAQWMHRVFPRECPYPHISGTKLTMLIDAWENHTGESVVEEEEEMRRLTESYVQAKQPFSLPWSNEEELFVHHCADPQVRSGDRGVAMAFLSAGVLAVVVTVLRSYAPDEKARKASNGKYCA